ncbi:MAG: MarR family transcriptional regulator [Devosia sp.]
MSRTPALSRDETLARLMNAMQEASGLSVLHSTEMARRLGINSTDLECLDLITRAGEMSPTALAQATGVTTGAITGVLDRLERAGFVKRGAAEGDRRRLVIRPVPEAVRKASALGEPMARAITGRLAAFDDRKLALLLEMVGQANDAARSAIAELASSPKKP